MRPESFTIGLLRALFWALSRLPVRCCGGLGAGLGRLAFYLDQRHQRVALNNLARVFPSKGKRWCKKIARESFAELGRSIFEMPHVFLRSKSFLLSRVTIEGAEHLRRLHKRGQSALFVGCHQCNWELGSMLFSALGYDTVQIYRRLNQPTIDRYVRELRGRFGTELHDRNEPLRWIVEAVNRGAFICMMVDQHLSTGFPAPFLGHLANTTPLPARLARKYGVPIFAVTMERIGRQFLFRIKIQPMELPTPMEDRERDIFEILTLMNQMLAPSIQARPECWLWVHRRWRLLEHEERSPEVALGTP